MADLAYARTVGEPLEDSRAEVMTPRNTLMERVTRYEAERKASETAAVSPGSKSLPEKELTPNTPLVTEPPAIPPAVEKTTDKHTAASIVEEVVAEKPTACEEPREDKVMEEVIKQVTALTVVNEEPTLPPIEDKKSEPLSEAKADSVTSASNEAPPVPAPASPSSITATSSIPIIRPVPKQTTEAPKATVPSEPAAHSPPVLIYKTPSSPVQKTPSTPAQKTASTPAQKTPSTPAQKTPSTSAQKTPSSPSSKVPITITKYVPPGQKPASSSPTKLTISMTTPYPDKDVKPTIKTLLPMRPPNQEARETQESPKPKEIKSKEESEDETTNKSKPRKRIFSEAFPKKPKLLKPTTGSAMESLPLEMVEHIAQYLTPQELAACCAVSVGWRDIFNQEAMWKPHCNKVIAENLETVQCRVEPGFVSPESEDSTLSPVCRWRLCYMRQKHLQNNWRKFKHVREEIRGNEILPPNENLPCILVSNDFVIIPNLQRIELWDLRNAPVYLERLFCNLFETDYYVLFVIDEDTIVILNACVQVYTFNSFISTWQFKYFFFYTDEQVRSPHVVNSSVNFPVYKFNHFTYNIGHYLIYSLFQDNQYFRVWDLQKGKFLKKERFPEYVNSNKGCIEVLMYLYTQETKPIDIAVVTVIYKITRESCVNFFYAYSLKECKFQPFKIRHEFYFETDKCVLVDNIFAVHDDTSVYIYNVVTTHLLLKVNTIPSEILTKLGKIIIINEVEIYVFDLQTLKLRCIKEIDEMQCMGWLSYRSFGYPLIEKLYYTVTTDNSFNVWEAGNSKIRNIISIDSYRDLRCLFVNECKTKVILQFNKSENNGFTVLTFW